mgnify:CR=1 FL=1
MRGDGPPSRGGGVGRREIAGATCPSRTFRDLLGRAQGCSVAFLTGLAVGPQYSPTARSGFHTDTRDPKYGIMSLTLKLTAREPKTP